MLKKFFGVLWLIIIGVIGGIAVVFKQKEPKRTISSDGLSTGAQRERAKRINKRRR